jgi:hypothetical protein
MYINFDSEKKESNKFSIMNIISALCHVTADTYLKHKSENNQKESRR